MMFEVKKQFSVSKKQLSNWYSKSISERNELNNQSIDKKLISWDEMLDNTPVRKIIPFHVKTNLVFFHVPKTAGTTLDFVISKNLPIWGLFKQHGSDFDRNVAAFYKAGVVPKAILGHNELNEYFYQLLDREKLIHITTIREPVARVLSYYNFLRSQADHPSHQLATDLTLKEFVLSSKADEVNNAQTFRILGMLKNKAYKDIADYDQSIVDAAVHQLTNRFTIFGTADQFDAFLLMLCKTLKWQDIYYKKHNVTKAKFKVTVDQLDDETLQVIKDKNQMDLAMYHSAEKVFAERMEQIGISDEHVKGFKVRNAQYQSLLKQNMVETS